METTTPSHPSQPPSSPPVKRRGRYGSSRSRNKAQSLAEFALMLPFLLFLIFMIMEFGRMFQTWVTLQNSARAAARYASTGQVNYDIFDVTVPGNQAKDVTIMNAIVPCDPNTPDGASPNDLGAIAKVNQIDTYSGYDGLFATWYDGTDCDPTQEDHIQYRKDILRLISVMYEAREAVNALGPETLPNSDDHYFEKLDANEARNLLYSYWLNPMPRESDPRWFNVTICSSRGLLDPVARTNPSLHPNVKDSRFITVRSDGDLTGIPADKLPEAYPMPYCLLNEVPPPALAGNTYTALNHAGIRWLDAGSPGDRVTIAVTYNHPLITPIRPDDVNFLTMRARRSIVNESFRAPKSTRILANPKVTGSQGGSGSLFTPTFTLPATDTPVPTATATSTSSATPTPPAFSCANLNTSWGAPPFQLNNIQFFINNQNLEGVELQSVYISWRDIPSPWNNMYLGVMALDDDVHWVGQAAQNVKSGGTTSVTTGQLTQGYRIITPQSGSVWTATYFNGPTQMEDYLTLYDFEARFVFVSQTTKISCTVDLDRPPVGEATEPPPPPTDGPTPTNTPNCASSNNKVSLKFGGFGSFGGVWFNITNNSGRDMILTGFDLVWPDATHPQISGEPTDGYGLAKVIIGGDNVVAPDGQRLWQANPPVKPGNTQLVNYNNRTISSQKGTWLSNGTLPPGTTRIYLDFDSFGGKMSDFGAADYHFDKSRFKIACGGSGGSGGGGDSSSGDIGVDIPTPKATDTPKPSPTKGPTATTGPATMTRTATATRTQGPTSTITSTSQATFTPSRTPFVQPTQPGSGGGE